MEESNIIYMDVDSYNRCLGDIDKLAKEKRKIDLKKGEVHKNGTDVAWDNLEFFELERLSEMLDAEIRERTAFVQNVQVVKQQSSDDVVGFGDVLRLSIFDQYGVDEIIGKLVGEAKYDKNSDYDEISSNGLIGKLIYGRKVGEKISYVADGFNCYVQVMEKLKVEEKKNNVIIKKLVSNKK